VVSGKLGSVEMAQKIVFGGVESVVKEYDADAAAERLRREAVERAPAVWPPAALDVRPAGRRRARAFVRQRLLIDDDDLSSRVAEPDAWAWKSVEERLVTILARCRRDVFTIFESERRRVRFYVRAGSFIGSCNSGTSPAGPASDRLYTVKLGADAIEAQDPAVPAGILVHELCHVLLDHPSSPAWPEDPTERRAFVDRIENEAVRLALNLGFRAETEAYVRYGVDAYGWDNATASTLRAIMSESDS
jgi:hypothetical protein